MKIPLKLSDVGPVRRPPMMTAEVPAIVGGEGGMKISPIIRLT